MFVNFLSLSSIIILHLLPSSSFIDSFVDFLVGYHSFPRSCAAFKCTLYSPLLSVSFSICKNLISSLCRSFIILCLVIVEVGKVFGIFILAYCGVRFFVRH